MAQTLSAVLAPRFQGKRVIVTGAGSGMGRAIVRRLVGEGAVALAVDVNQQGLMESVADANAAAGYGGAASWVEASVADETAVKRLVAGFAGGGLDVLINMAGILRASRTTDTTVDQFMELIQVNLLGTFLCCREALPYLEQSGGNIVNAASTAAQFGHPYMAAYSASKGGVLGLTQALAKEYMLRGVRVNAIVPGGIQTPMFQSMAAIPVEDADMRLFMNLARPDRTFGESDQVASVVAMLASGDGAYLSGQSIRIDGGVHG
ncbi:MAG TPA: SDR family oxidoreductase [Duganella sp.]|nr:SDR family oxidoreductase [Duganella sp.]